MFHILLFIFSVGKSNQQTSALKRTDAPVWEQGFTFLVSNPENDTLQIRLVDQKTEKDLGQFTFILSTLLTKSDLQVVSQPFQLQKSGPTSKIIMSLALKILKRPGNQTIESQTSVSSESPAIQRQASIASQSSQMEIAKNVKLAEFPKTSEVLNEVNSAVEPMIEKAASVTEFISNEAANVLADSPTLRQRQLSAQASINSSSLGRIQVSLSYSSERQRLIVIIHKIM